MRIVIIGSGNLATQLSLALKEAGKDIIQVYSRTEEHARTLAEKIGCGFTTSVDDVNRKADLYIVSIKDDAIRAMAAKLTGVGTVIHTAGSIPMNVFSGHADHYGVLYPMQTFSKNRKVDFREIPCFIEASDAETLAAIRQLAECISDHVVDCDSERRKKMHLAAVLACNLTNHCYRLAERVVNEENYGGRKAQQSARRRRPHRPPRAERLKRRFRRLGGIERLVAELAERAAVDSK